ncbi:MAG: hypothetical protein SGPRY_003306, partial [Prymnesium sp.]
MAIVVHTDAQRLADAWGDSGDDAIKISTSARSVAPGDDHYFVCLLRHPTYHPHMPPGEARRPLSPPTRPEPEAVQGVADTGDEG